MSADPRSEALFLILVSQFRDAAMLSLGVAPHPMTGKVERNLEAARLQIDILGMLEEKTEGHRSDVESQTLQNALTDLRIRFVEEMERGDQLPREKDRGEKDRGEEDKASEDEEAKGSEGEAPETPSAQRKEDDGVAEQGETGERPEGEEKGQ